jgi:hypothetical protein
MHLQTVNSHVQHWYTVGPLVEGTLEFSELYSTVDVSRIDVPKPVIDEPPKKVDIKFMKRAREVAEKSNDKSTKVNT